MDPRTTQQTRQTAAQQLTQWAATKSLPPGQLEQMVNSILTGQNDAQILQAAGHQPTQEPFNPGRQPQPQTQPQTQQRQPFVNPFGSQMPFNPFQMPAMPTTMNPTAPSFHPLPPTNVPNMFPNTGLQPTAPSVHTTRTTFPGGETTQQSSSHAGQQGNTSFKYSSSSTSTNFNPGAQFPVMQPSTFPSLQYNATQQPARTVHQPPPLHAPAPVQQQQQQQPLPQIQHHHHQHHQAVPPPYFAPTQPQFSQPTQAHIYDDTNVFSPDPIYNSAVPDQSPQNPRLAETFRRQLDEATYFSDVPGMPDLSVRRS